MTYPRLPLLTRGEYAPLKETLAQTIDDVMNDHFQNFTLDFRHIDVNTPPFFVQGFKFTQNTLQLEVSRRAGSLPAAQLRVNDLFMDASGWAIPSKTVEGFPNYIRKVDSNLVSNYFAADLLIDASIAIGQIDPNTWLEFGPENLSTQISLSKTLWHSKTSASRLCIPGQNLGSTAEAP